MVLCGQQGTEYYQTTYLAHAWVDRATEPAGTLRSLWPGSYCRACRTVYLCMQPGTDSVKKDEMLLGRQASDRIESTMASLPNQAIRASRSRG